MSASRVILTPRQLFEWRNLDPLLVEVVETILSVWRWPSDFIVTCIARTLAEDLALGGSGIHASGPPWRALDFRISHLGQDYQSKADQLADEVNARWQYDAKRPSMRCLITAPHGNGPHGHVQVGAATRRR